MDASCRGRSGGLRDDTSGLLTALERWSRTPQVGSLRTWPTARAPPGGNTEEAAALGDGNQGKQESTEHKWLEVGAELTADSGSKASSGVNDVRPGRQQEQSGSRLGWLTAGTLVGHWRRR